MNVSLIRCVLHVCGDALSFCAPVMVRDKEATVLLLEKIPHRNDALETAGGSYFCPSHDFFSVAAGDCHKPSGPSSEHANPSHSAAGGLTVP